jgi:hypothetical protein
MKNDPPRPLTTSESAVLSLLLGASFPGVAALREQAASALVDGRCDCGCPSVSLQVPPDAPRAPAFRSRLAPSEGHVRPAGDGPPGEIILFVEDGCLSYLEYVFFDDPPAEWPDISRIQVVETVR